MTEDQKREALQVIEDVTLQAVEELKKENTAYDKVKLSALVRDNIAFLNSWNGVSLPRQ